MAKITTITNPLTGQPAQVDQLDHTAQEIDDGIARALPGGAIDIALANVLHTGNKPSGSYTGNGSATSRTIDTGGIGSVIMLREGQNYFGFAGESGCVMFGVNTSTMVYYPYGQVHFSNGVLTLATNSAALNYNGGAYYYQVL